MIPLTPFERDFILPQITGPEYVDVTKSSVAGIYVRRLKDAGAYFNGVTITGAKRGIRLNYTRPFLILDPNISKSTRATAQRSGILIENLSEGFAGYIRGRLSPDGEHLSWVRVATTGKGNSDALTCNTSTVIEPSGWPLWDGPSIKSGILYVRDVGFSGGDRGAGSGAIDTKITTYFDNCVFKSELAGAFRTWGSWDAHVILSNCTFDLRPGADGPGGKYALSLIFETAKADIYNLTTIDRDGTVYKGVPPPHLLSFPVTNYNRTRRQADASQITVLDTNPLPVLSGFFGDGTVVVPPAPQPDPPPDTPPVDPPAPPAPPPDPVPDDRLAQIAADVAAIRKHFV